MIATYLTLLGMLAFCAVKSIQNAWVQNNGKSKEIEAENFLKVIEFNLSANCNQQQIASFNYKTNISNETAAAQATVGGKTSESQDALIKEMLEKFPDWKTFKNEKIRNQFKYLLMGNAGLLSNDEWEKLNTLQSEISLVEATATICEYKNNNKCGIPVHPDISNKLRNVQNLEENSYYWTTWHDTFGKAITPTMYEQLVNLNNKLAQTNGFKNEILFWLSNYDDHTPEWSEEKFQQNLLDMMQTFQPYFNKFQAYVRMKLKKHPLFSKIITEEGYLPIHMLGSVLSHEWTSIAEFTMPYPDASAVNVTLALLQANFTPTRIVQEAEKFFTSLNPEWKMPDSFWKKSLFERPADREVNCHPGAFDFCVGDDFRFLQCITVNDKDMYTAYHEMGHLVYYIQYRHLPFAFRKGPNPGFHEAIGDTIALSLTPRHLKCTLGLNFPNANEITCDRTKPTERPKITEDDINVLFYKALSRLVFIPWAMTVDFWRLKVYSGSISKEEYNTEWWKIRRDLQGIVPPSPRNPSLMDPTTTFHVANNYPYINYFVSYILQFQFYEAMCKAAGEFDPKDEFTRPLHQCDFSNSRKAGNLLKDALTLGASKDWRSVLEQFTGYRDISFDPMINYFKPLFDHIDKELAANNEPPCFGIHCKSTYVISVK